MIECIFTLDYEIYGNGEGSLRELVFEPAKQLIEVFHKYKKRFVVFVEVAELEMIETKGTDSAIDQVLTQLKEFQKEGCELALHIHPQWYNAQHLRGKWLLDYNEYNLCKLPLDRITHIIDRAIAYYRYVLGTNNAPPFAFRAGNWLFQPARIVATVLAQQGIKVDSSVFKGGLQHSHKLDYRRALKNGYFWRFSDDVNDLHPSGDLLEVPVYTRMVPTWNMFTRKRIALQKKGPSVSYDSKNRVARFRDFLRFQYPLKFDFCRMTMSELIRIIDSEIREDQKNPTLYRPIVSIGHTKDFEERGTLDSILSYLEAKRIPVSTFKNVYPKCMESQ